MKWVVSLAIGILVSLALLVALGSLWDVQW